MPVAHSVPSTLCHTGLVLYPLQHKEWSRLGLRLDDRQCISEPLVLDDGSMAYALIPVGLRAVPVRSADAKESTFDVGSIATVYCFWGSAGGTKSSMVSARAVRGRVKAEATRARVKRVFRGDPLEPKREAQWSSTIISAPRFSALKPSR